MGYVVTGLPAYVEQNKVDLIVKAQLKSKTASLLTLQTGVKSPTTLNLLSTSMTAQARGCGWNQIGTATITQRTLNPARADFKLSFCSADLEQKYLTTSLAAGALQEDESLPFKKEMTDSLVKGIGAIIEQASWKGDTGSGNANLNKGDGLIKIIDAAAASVGANTAPFIGTPITTVSGGIKKTNISSIIDAMVAAIPAEIISNDDNIIFCGSDIFRLYVQAIKDQNLFHYAESLAANLSLVVPGTMIRLEGVDGLNGTSRLFGIGKSNVFYGVDLQNDAEQFKMFYSQDNDEMRFVSKCNYGFQVAYPDLTVQFTLV